MINTARIAPSILSADFARMAEGIKRIETADLIHCDVMDGVFVPNISFGPKMIADIRKVTKLPLDVHLMITDPVRYIEAFAKAGADYLTVHYEACGDSLCDVLKRIRGLGVKSGAVINPQTPASAIADALPLCDMVLLMSVNPGFGGQSFIEPVLDKLKEMRRRIDDVNPACLLEIDGGVNAHYTPLCRAAGADVLVAGSFVFGAEDAAKTMDWMRTCAV